MINVELVGTMELNFSKAIEAFPVLAFFTEIASDTVARMVSYMLREGVSPEKLQEAIDRELFIITLAGAVYSQLQGNPSYGCDSRRDME